MHRLILTARVEKEDARYVATVEGLSAFHPRVQGAGDSPDVAREELIQAMITWISARDCSDSMADALAVAGFPEIDDETELQLEFDYSGSLPPCYRAAVSVESNHYDG